MLQSKLFTKTRKEAPSDEVSKNAQLLIRAGYVYKEMAGAYVYLPLGLTVFNNIVQVIREEMNKVGGQELAMTALQDKEVWNKTGRFDDEVVDVWFKSKLKNDTEVGLGFTHEEPITNMMRNYINSYRDLPISVYQFQTKFRNETRAKSGIMRGREFVMKDLYSFARTEEEHNKLYEALKQAYVATFNRLGIGEKTYITFASGGSFSKYSHEFQTITDAGEDIIYVDEEKKIAVNEEVLNDAVLQDLGLVRENLKQVKSAEVGNIFSLGTKFSDAFDLTYADESGQKQKVIMGSYGIGPGRVMGTIVELLSDEKGIVWPESIAPFKVHLLSFKQDEKAKEIYDALTAKGVEVLFDDRDVSIGVKLNDADLLGMPHRVLITEKSLAAGGVEYKKRTDTEAEIISIDACIARFS
ncbi:MAG: aminoacyl--tRNA ligase-related protein [Minisyncoccia bacterium]